MLRVINSSLRYSRPLSFPASSKWPKVIIAVFLFLSTLILFRVVRRSSNSQHISFPESATVPELVEVPEPIAAAEPVAVPELVAAPEPLAVPEPVSDPYYQRETHSFFPPGNGDATGLCTGFPTGLLDDVQVVVKTGMGELDKAKAHLRTTSSCIPNIIVISDMEHEAEGHHFIDILADLPQSYRDNNPDFDIYSTQGAALLRGDPVNSTHRAWKLDRFKFLPMVDRAYQMRPNARWYVFIEADTYIFWDTLFRLLQQLDSAKLHFMGNAIPGSFGRDFPYGGAGFVISNGLMTDLASNSLPLATQYEQWAKTDCCGDAVLAYAIFNRTGVRVDGLYPMFSGDAVIALPVNEEKWCTPLISLHHLNPKHMEKLWRWERTRPYSDRPLVHSDILHYTHPNLQHESTKDYWDNFSNESPPEISSANQSPSDCAMACSADTQCLQYSYKNDCCRLGYHIMLGNAVDEEDGKVVSGWQVDKIAALGFLPDEKTWGVCSHARWKRPTAHPNWPDQGKEGVCTSLV